MSRCFLGETTEGRGLARRGARVLVQNGATESDALVFSCIRINNINPLRSHSFTCLSCLVMAD